MEPFGPQWSSTCMANHGTKEDVDSTGCQFAVSVSKLPGIFSRTCAVMLLPKHVVSSKLDFSIRVKPHADLILPEGVENERKTHFEGNYLILQPHSSGVIYSFGADKATSSKGAAYEIRKLLSFADAGISGDGISFSKPVICDDGATSEQFVWLQLSSAKSAKVVLRARTVTEGSTTITTLADMSTKPAYRIENRAASAMLRFRQRGRFVIDLCLIFC